MSAPEYSSPANIGGAVPDRANDETTNLTAKAQDDLAEIGEELKQQALDIGEEAKTQVGKLADKAKGMAGEQKDLLANQLTGISEALGKVAGELESQDESSAHYVRAVASSAQRLTSTVRDSEVDDIIAMAQDFGRRQPAAFIGAAALLGFAASRFVLASAGRRSSDQKGQSGSSGAYEDSRDGARPSYSQAVGGDDAGL